MNGSLKLLRGLFLFVVDDPLGRRVEKPVQFPSFRRDPNRPKLSVVSLRLGKKKKTLTATSRKIVTGGRRVPGRGRHSMDFPLVD